MTTAEQSDQNQSGPSETFIEQVKDALEHLYDFPYLQRHPLARQILPPDQTGEGGSQRLRHELVSAIESLNPGTGVPFQAPFARVYNLLLLHYVEGMTIQEASHELGISRRQAHRDLRRGDENIATLLWNRRITAATPEPRAIRLSSIEAEMARLETHPRPTDARLLLEGAQKAVEPLAVQAGVRFLVEAPEEPVVVSLDPAVARQVLITILSSAVREAQPGSIRLKLNTDPKQTSLALCYMPQPQTTGIKAVHPLIAQLTARLNWTVRQEDEPDGSRNVRLTMASAGSTVLIIDDNEGLVELLTEYLAGHACRVVATTSGLEGLQLAEELVPDAIVLDVMIPEIDGWEVLQRLRHRPQTAQIPVIICSVFNNPELAYSLGASLFLPKPVSRDDVLAALRRVEAM